MNSSVDPLKSNYGYGKKETVLMSISLDNPMFQINII